jgi:hypothetical protein
MNDLLKPDDTRDALRKIGGLLFGLGALMIYIRKGPFLTVNPDQWAEFPIFLVLAVPAVVLYGSVLTRPQTGELRPWQLVYSVFGLVFVFLALTQLVDVIGGNPSAQLNLFWISLATAGLAFYAGVVLGVRVQLLLGSILLILSWSALWGKLLWPSACSPGVSTCGGPTPAATRWPPPPRLPPGRWGSGRPRSSSPGRASPR